MFKLISEYLLDKINPNTESSKLTQVNKTLIINTAAEAFHNIDGVEIEYINRYNINIAIDKYFENVIIINGGDLEVNVDIRGSEFKYVYIDRASENVCITAHRLGCVYINNLRNLEDFEYNYHIRFLVESVYTMMINKVHHFIDNSNFFNNLRIFNLYTNNLEDLYKLNISCDSNCKICTVTVYKGVNENNYSEYYEITRKVKDAKLKHYPPMGVVLTPVGGNILKSDNNIFNGKLYDIGCYPDYLYVPIDHSETLRLNPIIDDCYNTTMYADGDNLYVCIPDDIQECIIDITSIMINRSARAMSIYLIGGESLDYLKIESTCGEYIDILNLVSFKGKCPVLCPFQVRNYIPGPYIHLNKVEAKKVYMAICFKETLNAFNEVKSKNKNPVFPMFFGKCEQLKTYGSFYSDFNTDFLFENFIYCGSETDDAFSIIKSCESGVREVLNAYKEQKKNNEDSFEEAYSRMRCDIATQKDKNESLLERHIPSYEY